MKADVEKQRAAGPAASSVRYVGRFVRRTGNFGIAAAVGCLSESGIDLLDDPEKLFPKDGTVETMGVQHAHLKPDDWILFDAAKNTRPGKPEYRVHHIRPLPRYAVLVEGALATYRALLTVDGWDGEKRPGLWALRIVGDRVLVVDLVADREGRLRLTREGARNVRWRPYRDVDAASVNTGSRSEFVYLGDHGEEGGTFDWSEEADHVARVIRSLEEINDPRVNDIISWLDLHHEERTGRIFAATEDHDAADAALRSGELAERLRADRRLMKTYLDAAVENPDVREAIERYAKEGESETLDRIRAQIEREMAAHRERRMGEIEGEVVVERTSTLSKLEDELRERDTALKTAQEMREAESEAEFQLRLAKLSSDFDGRQQELEKDLRTIEERTAGAREAEAAAVRILSDVQESIRRAEATALERTAEIDRLLAISSRISGMVTAEVALPSPTSVAQPNRAEVTVPRLPALPLSSLDAKGRQVGRQVLLSEKGQDLLRKLMVLLLAGELPIIFGEDTIDFLAVAGAHICPGRVVDVEADPTLMGVEDVWSRPGSATPTMASSAATAAEQGGAVLVVMRNVERSGARFWMPALADALRRGMLPRPLLMCCTVSEPDHEELAALPAETFILEAEGVFKESAWLGGPTLLTSPALDLTAMDPGPKPTDLSEAGEMLLNLNFQPGLGRALRLARVYVEAKAMLGDGAKAEKLAIDLSRSTIQGEK